MSNKIGICIKEFDSIFTNGCAQQGYFVLKSFRKAGYEVNFVSIEDKLKHFEVINEPVYNICNIDKLKEYKLIMFSSLIVDQYKLLNQMKLLGIKIANLMVGNFYVINCEEFVFNVHNNIIADMNNEYVDEIWLMPMYTHVKEYIEGITKKPVKISPYVWDSEIISSYASIKNISPEYKVISNSETMDIIIMEPNFSIHKTSLPILVMLNQYFLKYPNRLGTIHMFGIPKRNENCLDCIKHLDIVKCKKILLYPRTLSLEIFHRLKKSNIKYLMISNNIRNGLNFIHLECFTLNIPIIHNCKPYRQSGLFYEDSDEKTEYHKVIQYINDVYDNKSINDKKGCLDILLKYHSYNKENVNNYKKLADELLLKDKPSIYDLNNIFSEQPKEMNLVDEFVIVIPINKLHNPKVLYKNLSKLNENQIKQKVVLYLSNIIIDTDKISSSFRNLNIEYINCYTNDVELYALANTKYKKICFINQNTIMYMLPKDMKETLLSHNALISVKHTVKYGNNDDEKYDDYIDALFKAFGKEYNKNNLFDNNFFMYINTPAIRYFISKYLENKNLLSFLPYDYRMNVLLSLLSSKIVLIESTKKIVANKMVDDTFYAFGYLKSCDNIVLFISIDPYMNKNINLDTKLIVDFKEESIHRVKDIIFRNIEFKKDYVVLNN